MLKWLEQKIAKPKCLDCYKIFGENDLENNYVDFASRLINAADKNRIVMNST